MRGDRNVIVAAAFMTDTAAAPDSSKQLIDMLAGPDYSGITSAFLAKRQGWLLPSGLWNSGSLRITAKNTKTRSARYLLNVRPLWLCA